MMKTNGLTIAGFVFSIAALIAPWQTNLLLTPTAFFLSFFGYLFVKEKKLSGEKLSVASFIMLGLNLFRLITPALIR
ncbi:MAG: hypothetical protein ACI3V0_11295 [Faecousia sp.]